MQYVLLFFFCVIGLYSLLSLILRIPPGRAKKNLLEMSITRKSPLKKTVDTGMSFLVTAVAKLMPLTPRYEADMSGKLSRAGIKLSPKEYYARAAVFGTLVLPIPVIGFVLQSPLIQMIGIILPLLVFRKYSIEHTDILKKHTIAMSRDIPHFVRSVLYRIGQGKQGEIIKVDLIQVFEDYIKISPESIKNELKLLVTEMKSRSVELGLRNFADRLGITEIRQMVNALVGIYHGQNQTTALATLSREIDILAKEHRQRELNKQPGRIRIATIPVVAVAIVTLLYVVVMHVFLTSNGLF